MKSHNQRVEYIRKRVAAAKKEENTPTYTIKNWRGKHTLYPKIIQVDVDYLMFRLENSRTEIQQLNYLRTHPSLPKDLFSDPESEQAQEAQEEILNEINKASGKEFFEDLKARGQNDAAIITFDGYLINGNRRTAALKSLGERYIDCAVLPDDTTPKDIYGLEQDLQISEDFKENYHWINELKNIRRGMEDSRYGFKEDEMATRLGIDIKELKARRRMMQLLDAFLIWKGIPGEYDYPKLDDVEQAFIQLEKALNSRKFKEDPRRSAELTNGVFILIEQKPPVGRLYGYVGDLIKNFDQVYEKMKSAAKGTESKPSPTKKQDNQTGDLLDDILSTDEDTPEAPIFDKASDASTIAPALVEKIADVKAENKEKNDTEAVYNGVSEALRQIQNLVIDNDTAKLEEIKNKITQLLIVAEALREQIKSFEN